MKRDRSVGRGHAATFAGFVAAVWVVCSPLAVTATAATPPNAGQHGAAQQADTRPRIEPSVDRRAAIHHQPEPPPQAYQAVLNDLLRTYPPDRDVGLSPANLPEDFGPEHLEDLPITLLEEEPCTTLGLVRFEPFRQDDDGAYVLTYFASIPGRRAPPAIYRVRCVDDECFIVGKSVGLGRFEVIICP